MGELGIAAAGAGINAGLGMISNAVGSGQSRKMAKFNTGEAKKLWDYTNAENQVKHYKNAGLNVGLMYENGGATGTTSGAGSGQVQAPNLGMVDPIGAKVAESQVELNKANANLANVEANKRGGVDTANVGADTEKKVIETKSIAEGINNLKAEQQLKNVMSRAGEMGIRKLEAEIESIGYRNNVDSNVIEEQIQIARNEALGGQLRNVLTKAQTSNTLQMTEESKERVIKMAQDVAQGWKQLDVNTKNSKIQEFKANIESEYPGAWNIIGKVVNDIIGLGDDDKGEKLYRTVEGEKEDKKEYPKFKFGK